MMMRRTDFSERMDNHFDALARAHASLTELQETFGYGDADLYDVVGHFLDNRDFEADTEETAPLRPLV